MTMWSNQRAKSFTGRTWTTSALEWLYPTKCALCGLLAESSPCDNCVSEMDPAQPNYLSEPEDSPLSYRACVFAYCGRAAQAVRRLKYGRCTSLSDFIAKQVAECVERYADPDTAIVPVPIHLSRRTSRGFNQAEICASLVRVGKLEPTLLGRIRPTCPQAGLSLQERERNLHGAFQASKACAGREVFLIDDVVTSGHTARACAKSLKDAGASSVAMIAFCGNLD